MIYEAADPRFCPQPAEVVADVRARYGLPDRYLLFVGTIEPRKNLGRILTAFERLHAAGLTDALVIVGKRGWLYDDFFARLEGSPAKQAVIFPGFVPDADLPAVYAGSQALPSPASSRGSACPCLRRWPAARRWSARTHPACRRWRGDAALLIDPLDVDALTDALRRVLSDPALAADLTRARADTSGSLLLGARRRGNTGGLSPGNGQMRPHYILDARTATPHFPGIGRYVTNLARALMPLLTPDERLTVLHDPAHPISLPPSDAVRTVPLAVSPFSLAQQWVVPRLMRSFYARRGDIPASSAQLPAPSLYHSPYVVMPYLPGVPALLTVYDLIPLRYPAHSTARARLLIRWMTRLALRGGAPCDRDLRLHPSRLHGRIRPSARTDYRHSTGGRSSVQAANSRADRRNPNTVCPAGTIRPLFG